jgi:hypothetical protein
LASFFFASIIPSSAMPNISPRRIGNCRLHLLARRIVVPRPRGGTIDLSAPLPPHMAQSWNLLGLNAAHYDPIVDE